MGSWFWLIERRLALFSWRAATLTEFALIAALVVIALVAALMLLGDLAGS